MKYPQKPAAPTLRSYGVREPHDEREDENVKRIISILLALIMALSLLPVSAFAAEPANSGIATQSGDVAQVIAKDGSLLRSYSSFEEALSTANSTDGCKLKVLQDVTFDYASANGSFELDGTGVRFSGYLTVSGAVKIIGGNFTRVNVSGNAKLAGGSYTMLQNRDAQSWNGYLPSNNYKFCDSASDTPLTADDLEKDTLNGVYISGGQDEPSVARINEDTTPYATLAAAIDAAKPSNTITLLATVDETVTIDRAITLDLDGRNITGSLTFTNSDARLDNSDHSGTGGEIASLTINVTDSSKTLIDILADQVAFLNAANGSMLSGAKKTLLNVQLGWHPECTYFPPNYICPCGRKGSSCDHSNVDTATGICAGCSHQFTASTTNGSTTTWYDTLQRALNAAQDGSTVKLFKTVTESFVSTPSATSFTIDWNGHTLTGTLSVTVGSKSNGEPSFVTLTDTSGTNNGGVTGTIDDSAVHLRFDAGRYSSIPYVNPGFKTQLDRLADGCAFVDANNNRNVFNANRKAALSNVQVIPHTCSAAAKPDGTCACGRHFDTTPPEITYTNAANTGKETSSSGLEQNFVEVHGNTLTFTITDADTAVKSVKINDKSVSLSNDGTYSIEIDDEGKNVDDNLKEGKQYVTIEATDTANNTAKLAFTAYRMVETKITPVLEGIKILSICGDEVTTTKPADYSRWRRAASPYWVEFQVENQPWFDAGKYLKLRLFYIERPGYTAKSELSCKKTSDGNYLFTTEAGNEGEAAWHLATYLKNNRVDKETGEKKFSYEQLKDIRIVRAEDTAAPDTTISFDDKNKEYTTFTTINQTTVYELFYKDSLTVNVTATDDNSGVASAKYLFTETKYTETQLQNATGWKTFSLTASAEDPATYTGSFTLNAGELGTKGFLYVRTKDNANNTTNVSADKGLVIYTDLQVTSADPTITLSLDEARSSDARTLSVNSGGSANKVTIKCKDESGNDITMNPVFDAYPHNEYTVDSDGNIVLTAAFLRSRAVGTYTLTITIDPMEEEYKDIAGNDKPTTVTVTLNVTKIKPTFTADNIPLSDKDFDGSAVNHPTIAPSITGGRNVRYEYKVKDADDNTYTTTPPTTAGDYVVKVTIEGDESYEAVTATKNFTISPKEVTITGTTVSNKVYNGNTDAVIANLGTLNGIVDSHNNVTIKDGSATFNNKNVGENKTVTFSGFTLEGADAKNYTLTAQPAAATASITPRLVTINGLAVDNKTYDGKPDATISADLTLTLAPVANNADSGIVPNDDVTLNPTAAKAEFENKNAGADKPVTFSDFALTGADAGNYTLVLPTDVTATIERKTLTVDGLKIADKTYDGTKTAQWDGTPTLIGLVEGETLQLICGVPTFTSATPGSNIPVTFTPFSLADGTGLAANYTLIQPVSGSITGNIVVNRHNHSRGPRPYLPQQPANGANGTNGGKDGVTSARTGDMGVALYAALSLASLSGTALLTRKRKETL